MADFKKPAPPSEPSITPGKVIAVVIGILILTSVVGKLSEENKFFGYFTKESESPALGDDIINLENISIRNGAGGNIVGVQTKGTKGRVMEGPVENFDKTWWRIDYEKAPDGWVAETAISNKLAKHTLFNIFPITFNFLRPIFIVLAIVAFLYFIILQMKIAAFNKTQQKKVEQKLEQKLYDSRNDAPAQIAEEDELPVPGLPVGEAPKTVDVHNKSWANIQSLIRSYNSNDWKQAILQADIILDEMVKKMGYKGDGLGERLKTVEASDFNTLDSAWEAHKFRNRIAHGNDYVLSKDEAEHVIGLYEEVFKEFFYI